jgi:hypothetical protein
MIKKICIAVAGVAVAVVLYYSVITYLVLSTLPH